MCNGLFFFFKFKRKCFQFFFQGMVAFSSQGDRIALTQIEQMINGQYTKLGYYDTQADKLNWSNKEQWLGNKVSNLRITSTF